MIPLSKPFLGNDEVNAAGDVILSHWVTQGPKVREFEELFAAYTGAKHACAVSSCTTALHLALLAVGVKPGDIVITVSYSFIATANSVRLCGAEPIFIDINPDTFNMCPEKLQKFLSEECESKDGQLFCRNVFDLAVGESPLSYIKPERVGRIAAILAVHQTGMPFDIEAILKISKYYNIPVVEDAACAVGSEILLNNNWEKIGKTHGDVACFSFHPRKILTTGDGGMITTNNPEFDAQFRLLRQHGMGVSDLARHGSNKVIIEDYLITGFNYRMTDIQAAVGIEQIKKLPVILENHNKVNNWYHKYFKDIEWLKLPFQPDCTKPNWQSYPVRVIENAPASRNEILQYFLDNKISVKPGVMIAHREAPYKNHCYNLPESEKARNEVIQLPVYSRMSEEEVVRIADLLKQL